MTRFESNFLSYSPRFSWQLNYPRIYFNRDLLAEGEAFKVRLSDDDYPYLRGDVLLNIDRIGTDQRMDETERRETILADLSLTRPSRLGSSMLSVGTGKEEALSPGLYVAAVSTSGFGAGTVALSEHRFYVAETEEYFNQWKYLFGETWDEPIFWDDLDPVGFRDLLCGVHMDDLLAVARKGIRWDGGTFFELLGPIMTVFMMNGFRDEQPLPFPVSYVVSEYDSAKFPHIDLTKLVWFLSVLGPIFADLSFFSYGVELATRLNSEGLFVDMRWVGPFTDELKYRNNVKNAYGRPAMFDVVKESIGSEINYQMKYEDTRLSLSMFSD